MKFYLMRLTTRDIFVIGTFKYGDEYISQKSLTEIFLIVNQKCFKFGDKYSQILKNFKTELRKH